MSRRVRRRRLTAVGAAKLAAIGPAAARSLRPARGASSPPPLINQSLPEYPRPSVRPYARRCACLTRVAPGRDLSHECLTLLLPGTTTDVKRVARLK